MGMRTKEANFCFETIARRDSYIHPDNCGELLGPKDYEEGGYVFGLPEQLRPDLDSERGPCCKSLHAALVYS